MKLSCPACGSLSSLDALLGNEGAREAVMAALAMPAPHSYGRVGRSAAA